jgi:hypothetical protein
MVLGSVADDIIQETGEKGGLGFMLSSAGIPQGFLASASDSISDEDGDTGGADTGTSGVMIYPDTYGPETLATGDEAQLQTRRFLKVVNDTGEKIELHVQYRTKTTDGDFAWFPADPVSSDRSGAYDLDPGEATFLSHYGQKVNANRIRIWAVSDSGREYNQLKHQDLWLVPENNGEEHFYSAPEMQTFVLALAP